MKSNKQKVSAKIKSNLSVKKSEYSSLLPSAGNLALSQNHGVRGHSLDRFKNNRCNFLYKSMKRQYTNLKELDREKSLNMLQKLKNPLYDVPHMPKERTLILKPKDPFEKALPPRYQAHLDETFNALLSKAMSKSSIMTVKNKTNSPQYRAKSHLTNAEHHAMKKNH